MRQILSISKQTKGRPQEIDPPSEGWSYETLGELPAGTYHVELGAPADDDDGAGDGGMAEDSIAAGHTFAILARSSGSWDTLCRAQQRTIDQQAKLIAQLHAERIKALQGKDSDEESSPLQTLLQLAPLMRQMMLGDGKGKSNGNGGSDDEKK